VDEIKEPLCSVCKPPSRLSMMVSFFSYSLQCILLRIRFDRFLREKKDEDAFFNTAPDADDDILCSYIKVSRSRVLAFCVSSAFDNGAFCLLQQSAKRDEMRLEMIICENERSE